jgi:hypothetical protein
LAGVVSEHERRHDGTRRGLNAHVAQGSAGAGGDHAATNDAGTGWLRTAILRWRLRVTNQRERAEEHDG